MSATRRHSRSQPNSSSAELVDCWNGDIEPVVYHGKTLTSKVSVRDICVAIKRYGFMASPYPIIISAEIHCGLQQQVALVRIMKDTFGPALVSSPLKPAGDDGPLPSPEDLRYRILLKVGRGMGEGPVSWADSRLRVGQASHRAHCARPCRRGRSRCGLPGNF